MSSLILACPRHPALAVVDIPGKGRGIIVTEFVPAHTLLEVAPALRLTKAEVEAVMPTLVDDYLFDWQEASVAADGTSLQYDSANVLGLTSLLNHSENPTARLERDFATQTMRLISIRDMAPPEEVTFKYQCGPRFEVRE